MAEVEGTVSIWQVYFKNVKKYVAVLACAVLMSSGYNGLIAIDFTSTTGEVVSSYLAPNYGDYYSYNARSEYVGTKDYFLDYYKLKNNKGETVASDKANTRDDLIGYLSTNIGERITLTDPNHALDILSYRMEVVGNTVFLDIDVQNTLPVEIKDLSLIVVAHGDRKVYFEIPFTLNGVNIEPSKGYTMSLARDITGFEDEIPAQLNISLAAGYMR